MLRAIGLALAAATATYARHIGIFHEHAHPTAGGNSGIFHVPASTAVTTYRATYLKAVADCLDQTQDDIIGSFLKAVPTTNGPWMLVTDMSAADVASDDCPSVPKAYHRYVKQLNASIAGFMETLPQNDYTTTVMDAVSCDVHLPNVTTTKYDDAWWNRPATHLGGRMRTPTKGLMRGAMRSSVQATPASAMCPTAAWTLQRPDGSFLNVTAPAKTVTVALDLNATMFGSFSVVSIDSAADT
ncbi:hypothetical protein SDRG_07004 [Saprolegnia diclina VS20]|uniref:Uncharacterized protein n=1 Tax=Saprolegnia diclina (strain VS20) TaxID=1156394 RepID=T0QLX3_SAPDV|nr:hypothetical protein SDRG_07004 [Saprolegnia diclina VS20]EQC35726.1 hypothetical protein SDRG_07004 [Saprolegnia diclina VS20]|eukprot:XP_008611043.1 hypothetical protein SDRG_07004 [Saprolegnia diclina VS20]